MNKKFTKLIAALALLVFMMPSLAGWGQTKTDYEAVITFDCAYASSIGNSTIYGGSASTSMGPGHIKTFLNNAAGSVVIPNYPSSYSSVYWAKGSGGSGIPDNVLKIGTASGSGNCTFTIADSFDEISKVSITGYGWKNTTKVAVNGSATQSPSAAATLVTFDYVLSEATRTIAINITTSAFCATEIVLYKEAASSVYTVTYDCNGGESNCPSNLTDIEPGTSITLASAPTKPHYNFIGWKNGGTTYDAGASYTVNSNVTFIAQWESDGTLGEGSICFSNQSGCTVINNTSVTGDDDLGNTWTITTEGTTSFTNTSTAYSQVGSGSSPASSITFTTTFDEEVNVTNFSAAFGGFSATQGSVVLKVDNTQVGSGSLNGTADVTVSSSSAQIGTTLTVIVTPTAGGVKCYNISYTYEISTNPSLRITTPDELAYNATSGSIGFTINNPVATASVFASVPEGSWITLGTVDENSVPFTCTANTALSQRSETVTFVYVDGEETLDTKTVTITQAPAPDPTISAENVSIAYDAEEGYITYTINNPVAGGSITASTTAQWLLLDAPQEGSIYFYCGENSNFYAHSATVTLTYTYSDSKATVTKDITVTQALDPDANGSTAEFPINVSEAIEAIDEVGTVSNIYVGGIVSEITASTSNYITFKMYDEDGNDYYLQAYHCTGNNISEVAVGDQVVVYGTLEKYGTSVYQFASGCQLVSLTHPASITVANATVNVDAAEHVGTLALSYENLPDVASAEDFSIQYYDEEDNELAPNYDPGWIMVEVAEQDPSIGAGYVVSYYMVENEGEARTVYFKVYSLDAEAELVWSNLVTISQEEAVIPSTGDEWVLTNLADLTADDVFVIVGTRTDETYGGNYAMSNNNGTSSAPSAVAVTVDGENNKLTSTIGSNIQWNLEITNDGFIFHPNGTTSTWLYCNNGNDGVRVGTGDAKHFNFDENYTNYLTTTETNEQRFIGIYNSNDWRCYKLGSGNSFPSNIVNQTFAFYKKVSATIETYETTITAYTSNTPGWHLIASPLAGSVKAGDVDNLKSNDYDLYRFDQTQDMEWQNYKKHGFYLESGKGYLYANSGEGENETVTLTFTGVPYDGDGVIELDYSETNEDDKMWGWNLVGNPFGAPATLDVSCFTLWGESNVTACAAGTTINLGQGVLVKAEGTGESVTFSKVTTPEPSESNGNLNLVVAQQATNRGTAATLDNAIVSFNEGSQLEKFYFMEQNANLYIPQDGKEYAIATAEAQGEMPVNFKARENGTYTLTVNPENVEMGYLHLIDNMTGDDIDLLQTPSYTFNATTRDYESRFRLVFSANGENGASTGSATFAFISDGNLVVSNEGEATLQVVDLTGRILSNETIDGCHSMSMNAAPGVYMIRLINGNNVKVQKIVVR